MLLDLLDPGGGGLVVGRVAVARRGQDSGRTYHGEAASQHVVRLLPIPIPIRTARTPPTSGPDVCCMDPAAVKYVPVYRPRS